MPVHLGREDRGKEDREQPDASCDLERQEDPDLSQVLWGRLLARYPVSLYLGIYASAAGTRRVRRKRTCMPWTVISSRSNTNILASYPSSTLTKCKDTEAR